MGYSHIPQKYAKPINAFYEGVFNRDWSSDVCSSDLPPERVGLMNMPEV